MEAVSYRPIFNRNRTVLFLHPRPAEIADLIDTFQTQGFMTNVAVNLGSLARLIGMRVPDAVIAHTEVGQAQSQVSVVKDIAFGTRIYLLTDGVPAVAEVVRAVRSGALSVFTQPIQVTDILREIEQDLGEDMRSDGPHSVKLGGMTSLTVREREVLDLILRGGSNKEAAQALQISPRTIEVHRAHLMRKLGARNTAEMVRIALGK